MHRLPRVLLLSIAILLVSTPLHAVTLFKATLTGSQETPPNASPATGTAFLTVNDALTQFIVNETFSGLIGGGVTGAHIHAGPVGVAGPIIFDFIPAGFPTGVTSGSYTHTFTAADLIPRPAVGVNTFSDAINAIFAGNTYFNIHNATFPAGEIRGQILPTPEPASALLLGVGILMFGVGWNRKNLFGV